jgi:hypothetical protein
MSLYGCHNKPRPTSKTTHLAQSGYVDSWKPEYVATARTPVWIVVPHVMSTDCKYTQQHASDPQCSGCVHKSKEEA